MANALEKVSAIQTYRNTFASKIKAAADMSLHELVDEFQRLSGIIDQNTTYDESQRPEQNGTAFSAMKDRQIYASVANARFGVSLAANTGFADYDDTW